MGYTIVMDKKTHKKIWDVIGLLVIGGSLMLFASGDAFGAPMDEEDHRVLKDGIRRVSGDIRHISNTQRENYQDARDAMRRSSSIYNSYSARVNDLNEQFNRILGDYKPGDMGWGSFKVFRYHGIDPANKDALMNFYTRVTQIKADLSGLQLSMRALKREIEDKAYREPAPVQVQTRHIYHSTPYYRYGRSYNRPYYRHSPYYYGRGYRGGSGVYYRHGGRHGGRYGGGVGFHFRIK